MSGYTYTSTDCRVRRYVYKVRALSVENPTGMQDGDRQAELAEVRRELDSLVLRRLSAPLSTAEAERYERLLGWEQLLMIGTP